jgi:glucose/mannose-6-phosphate isomerase
MGDILAAIQSAPRQAREGLALGRKLKVRPGVQSIVFAGMGGSGIPGDLLAALLRDLTMPVAVSKDYRLPGFAGGQTLAVIISYSGDTEETLAAYRDAIRRKCLILAITSGGKLAELCETDKTPLIRIPAGLMPRQAVGYFLFALLGVLIQSGILGIKDEVLEQAINALANEDLAKRGEEIAEQLKGKVPVIYTSQALAGLGLRWKNQLNENGKVPAFSATFTELCHNEVEGLGSTLMKGFHIVILRDERDLPGVQKRMDGVKAILRERKIPVTEIALRGDHLLVRLCTALQLGDYASYHLAQKTGVDPYEVPVIGRLKAWVKQHG